MPEAVFVELRALISDFQSKMATARGEMDATSKKGGSSLQSLGAASGKALAAVGAGLVGVGILAVKFGMDLQDSQRRLKVAIEDAGFSFDKFKPQIDAADKRMEKLGFTTANTQDALAVMVTGLGNPTKALNSLGVAADLASFKHVDLAQASLAVTKALEGNMRPLHQLGIDLPFAASSANKVQLAQAALAKANAALAVTQSKLGVSTTDLAKNQLSSATNSLMQARAAQAVQLAQQSVATITERLKLDEEAVTVAAEKHGTTVAQNTAYHNQYLAAVQRVQATQQALTTAQERLTLAEDSAGVATLHHATVAGNSVASHDAYQKALERVQAAQTKLSDLQNAGTGILDALQKKIGGQAADAANTFAGKLNVAKAQAQDLLAKLGVALIPTLEKLMKAVSDVVQWFERHTAAAKALAAVIVTVLGAALVFVTVSHIVRFVQGIQSAITWLGNLRARSTETAAVVEGDNAAMGASASTFGSKLSGALGVAAAGIIAFQGTTALLKSNFLGIGSAVTSAAKAISDFFGGIGQVKPSTSLAPQAILFLEQVASGAVHAANITAAAAAADLRAAHVPGYQFGGYVPSTGLALLHAGETVIPASGSGGRGSGRGDLVIQLNGREVARAAGPDIQTWLLQSPGRNAVRGRLTT